VGQSNSDSCTPAASHGVIDQEHDNRANDCDNHAPDVEASDALGTKKAEQKAANKRADYSEGDVEPEALTLPLNDLAPNEPRDKAKYDPAEDAHIAAPFKNR
jgi:hypothetical protein